MTSELLTYASLSELHANVTESFCEVVEHTVQQRGICTVSLSGGSTPRAVYQMLADRDLPWDQIHWFWGDERNVPSDHPDSNYRMVREALLDHVPIPESAVHPVPVDVERPQAAAAHYGERIAEHFGGGLPAWDLVLLGLGDDGHTASLFPQTNAVEETERIFVENWVEKFNAFRYTLTAPAINSGKEIWFLVAGDKKRDALAKILNMQGTPAEYPAQLITPSRWFVTEDALAS